MPTLHERAEAVRSEWRHSISRWGSSPWEANQESDYSHKEVTAQSGSQGPTGESRHELEYEANTVDFTSPRRRTVPGPGFSSVLEVRQTELVQQDREGRECARIHDQAKTMVGRPSATPPSYAEPDRPAPTGTPNVGDVDARRDVVPQPHTPGVPDFMPGVHWPEITAATSIRKRKSFQNMGRNTKRIRRRSTEDVDPIVSSQPFSERDSPVRAAEVFCPDSPYRAKYEGTSNMGHEPTKSMGPSAALQGLSGSDVPGTDAGRRLFLRHGYQTVLPQYRTGKSIERFLPDMGRPIGVVGRDVRNIRTHYFTSADNSFRPPRRTTGDGKIAAPGRRANSPGRLSDGQNNGRLSGDDTFDVSTRESNAFCHRFPCKPGAPYLVEEITGPSGTLYRVLRNVVELDAQRRIRPQRQTSENIGSSDDDFAPVCGYSGSNSKHRRENTKRSGSTFSSSAMGQREPKLDYSDFAVGRVVHTRSDIPTSSRGTQTMGHEDSQFQWPERKASDDIHITSRRRRGIRYRRFVSRHAGGNPGSLAEREGEIVERTRATSRYYHRNIFHSTSRSKEHINRSVIGQHDERVLFKQAWRPDPVVGSPNTGILGVVPHREEHQNHDVPLPRNRYNRAGGGRVLKGDKPKIPSEPDNCEMAPESPQSYRSVSTAVSPNSRISRVRHPLSQEEGTSRNPDVAVGAVVAPVNVNGSGVSVSSCEGQPDINYRQRRRETEIKAISHEARISSLENLRIEKSNSSWTRADFKTQFVGARSEKADRKYELPWARWVVFSREYEPDDISNPEWNISIHKHAQFLREIWNGFGEMRTIHSRAIYRMHNSAVCTTFETGGMIDPTLPRLAALVKSSSVARNFLNAQLREHAASGNPKVGLKNASADSQLWDPCVIFEFWHNFPCLQTMQESGWPLTLQRILIRAKAVAILRLEGAARSSDTSSLSWLSIQPKFWTNDQSELPEAISIRYYNTKSSQLKKDFGAKSRPISLSQSKSSNSCVIQALAELRTLRTENEADHLRSAPVFTSLKRCKHRESGSLKFISIGSQRLSKVFRISLLAAEVKGAFPREARHMSSSKAHDVGSSDTQICNYGLWDSIKTFRKHYRKTSPDPCPTLDDPSFSAAVRAGMKLLDGSEKARQLKKNIDSILGLTQRELNCSTSSSTSTTLRLTHKVTDAQIRKAIKLEMKGVSYSFCTATRKGNDS